MPVFWSVWNVIRYHPFQLGSAGAAGAGAAASMPAVSAATSAAGPRFRLLLTQASKASKASKASIAFQAPRHLPGQRMHTPFRISAHTEAGGTGLIVGEKEFVSPGPTAFSVGCGVGALVPGA